MLYKKNIYVLIFQDSNTNRILAPTNQSNNIVDINICQLLILIIFDKFCKDIFSKLYFCIAKSRMFSKKTGATFLTKCLCDKNIFISQVTGYMSFLLYQQSLSSVTKQIILENVVNTPIILSSIAMLQQSINAIKQDQQWLISFFTMKCCVRW